MVSLLTEQMKLDYHEDLEKKCMAICPRKFGSLSIDTSTTCQSVQDNTYGNYLNQKACELTNIPGKELGYRCSCPLVQNTTVHAMASVKAQAIDNGGSPRRHNLRKRPESPSVSIEEFHLIKPISKGSFGQVYLARKKTTQELFAIKVIPKRITNSQALRDLVMERTILTEMSSPYFVDLYWAFQTKQFAYLVMEFVPGGDLMSLLDCMVTIDTAFARVYIAQIAQAIHEMHKKGFIHCDLKPENILISNNGHIKLADFGLSEVYSEMSMPENNNTIARCEYKNASCYSGATFQSSLSDSQQFSMRTFSSSGDTSYSPESIMESPSEAAVSYPMVSSEYVCEENQEEESDPGNTSCKFVHYRGTPDYIAPEVLKHQRHDPSVDYWALGVILYEMLVGFPPFNAETIEEIFENILENNILWPDGEDTLDPLAQDLICKLLEPNPALRLNWEGIITHPFFCNMNWDTLLYTAPPFKPTLAHSEDTSYFVVSNALSMNNIEETKSIDSNRNETELCPETKEDSKDEEKKSIAMLERNGNCKYKKTNTLESYEMLSETCSNQSILLENFNQMFNYTNIKLIKITNE